MKQLSPILTTIITSALVFVLLSLVLPGGQVSAFQPPQPAAAAAAQTAAPTAQPGAAAAGAETAPTTAPQPVCDASRSVQVSGTAVINVSPDRAMIQLGVQSNGTSPRTVEKNNTTATQAVIRAIQALGVDAKDIATDWYVIEPIYEDYTSLYIKGYRINNIVAVTLRDVSKTSQVIAAALQAGANQVIKVDLYTSELRKYRDQARDLAMKAAREKAQALASAAGAEAGCVLSIHENSWSYYNGWWSGRGQDQNQWTQNVVQNIAPSASTGSPSDDEPISLGQISVKAEISASFGLH